MRGLVGPIVVLAVLCAAAPARAGDVSLWACRGPDGAALGPVTTVVNGDVVLEPGCARARFTRPDPAAGSEAVARVDVPPATTLSGVRLDRAARGPGYSALTSGAVLESGDGDGVATFTATGEWVALRLRCEAAERCSDAGLAGFELRSAALTVSDTSAPNLAVGGVREPASGTLDLEVRATDTGVGLWSATASLDGTRVAGASFGGCTELSPADATIDLAVGALCPGVGQAALAVDTRSVPDGQHTLRVEVTDGAGNPAQSTYTLTVMNAVVTPTPEPTPTETPTPTPTETPTPTPTPEPTPTETPTPTPTPEPTPTETPTPTPTATATPTPTPPGPGEVRLWACHGPDGAGLPFSYSVSGTVETAHTSLNGGCSAANGSLNLAFLKVDPAIDQSITLRFNVPTGVTLGRVRLNRTATGPGYVARTSHEEIEHEDAGLRLEAAVDVAATGEYVELRLACTTSPRCHAPAAGVNFRSATITVRDTTAPSATISGIRDRGAFDVDVRATDSGIGLATTTLSVDGQAVVTRAFDSSRCRDLTPFDPTKDFSLSLGCTPSARVVLPLDTRNYVDGPHHLTVTVTDGAGNVRTSEQTIEFANLPTPPAATATPGPTTAPTATPAPTTAPPTARVPTVREMVTLPKRLTVSRRGSLSLSVLCPKDRPQTCRHRLTLAYQGREIGTGRGSSSPGRRVRVTLKLTRAAQRTLQRRRSLVVTLIVDGARRPASVRLRRP